MKPYKKLIFALFAFTNMIYLSSLKSMISTPEMSVTTARLAYLERCLSDVTLPPRLTNFTKQVIDLAFAIDDYHRIDTSFKEAIKEWILSSGRPIALDIVTYCTRLQAFCFNLALRSSLPSRGLFLAFLRMHGGDMYAPAICVTPDRTPSTVHGLTGTPPDARDASPTSPRHPTGMTRNVFSFHDDAATAETAVTAIRILDFGDDEEEEIFDPTFAPPQIIPVTQDITDEELGLRTKPAKIPGEQSLVHGTIPTEMAPSLAVMSPTRQHLRFRIIGPAPVPMFDDVPHWLVDTDSDEE